ncbi:flagellar hook assembly protein FlgD [Mesorhizobium xinjiangense]|uniref:flagellar hook assembly protein FlgD n=1 Tax=Mesorhizobium xinjiangense TaxID=2678685 RepID=UPI0012ECFBA6|nr:flagellar hook assembly protein FlgD [Mesorhizobium xinjiangense]
MSIPPVSSATTASAQSGSSAANAVDYETFLKLLVTQMENQDPTAPMDSKDYIAQLATFSQVEQTIQTNTKLDELLTTSFLDQAGALIGRTITSADGEVSGEIAKVQIYSDGVMAVLQDGTELVVGAGVTIS